MEIKSISMILKSTLVRMSFL